MRIGSPWPASVHRFFPSRSALLSIATDWQWLDDIAGKFSEDFLQNGRNQPALPPGRDMGPAFERGNKPLDVRWLSCQCERHRSLGQAGCHGGGAHEHL